MKRRTIHKIIDLYSDKNGVKKYQDNAGEEKDLSENMPTRFRIALRRWLDSFNSSNAIKDENVLLKKRIEAILGIVRVDREQNFDRKVVLSLIEPFANKVGLKPYHCPSEFDTTFGDKIVFYAATDEDNIGNNFQILVEKHTISYIYGGSSPEFSAFEMELKRLYPSAVKRTGHYL